MKWISIDPGIHCGYAIWDDEVLVKSGYFHPNSKGEPTHVIERERKINFLRRMLQSVITEFQCESAVVEVPIIGKKPSNTIITQLRVFSAIVDLVIYDNKLQYTEYLPNRIKKWSTGYGNACKESIQAMVLDIFGEEHSVTKDQADAVAIGMAHIAISRLIKGLPRIYPTDKYYRPENFKSDEAERERILHPEKKKRGRKKKEEKQ